MGRSEDRPRPCATTREEAQLRTDLLTRKITFFTFQRRFNKLKKAGLIQRNGRVVK